MVNGVVTKQTRAKGNLSRVLTAFYAYS